MTLTGDPELFLIGVQTLLVLSVLLVAASLLVSVLLVTALLSVAVLLVAAVLLVVAELLVEVVPDFGQGPLKGSVSGCVPNRTFFPVNGSAYTSGSFARSWA